MSATNAVSENKMEPVQPQPQTQQLLVTGQYLYENFVQAGEEQKSRMNLIRDLVAKGADPQQVKGATDEMVKIAIKKDVAAGVDEKVRGPKRATAMNVRTIFQTVYGALKFAPNQLQQIGFDDNTGWLEAAVMAKKALNEAKKVWQGFDVQTEQQKEQKALQRARKPETEAMLEATKQTPRLANEDFLGWQKRISDKAAQLVESAQKEAIAENALKLYEYCIKKYDRPVIAAAIAMLNAHFKEEANGQAELSDEEATALLAQAEKDGTVEVTEEPAEQTESEEQHA